MGVWAAWRGAFVSSWCYCKHLSSSHSTTLEICLEVFREFCSLFFLLVHNLFDLTNAYRCTLTRTFLAREILCFKNELPRNNLQKITYAWNVFQRMQVVKNNLCREKSLWNYTRENNFQNNMMHDLHTFVSKLVKWVKCLFFQNFSCPSLYEIWIKEKNCAKFHIPVWIVS